MRVWGARVIDEDVRVKRYTEATQYTLLPCTKAERAFVPLEPGFSKPLS